MLEILVKALAVDVYLSGFDRYKARFVRYAFNDTMAWAKAGCPVEWHSLLFIRTGKSLILFLVQIKIEC